MNIEILYKDNVTEIESNDLQKLSDAIVKSCDTQATPKLQKSESGQKDIGLIIGLTIAGFALSAIDTLINVLTYWQAQRTKYSISFSTATGRYTLETRSIDDFKAELSRLGETAAPKVDILIEEK